MASDDDGLPRVAHGGEWLRALVERPHTTEEMAERLGVSVRTAQRCGQDLLEQGWPIDRSYPAPGKGVLWLLTSRQELERWLGLRRRIGADGWHPLKGDWTGAVATVQLLVEEGEPTKVSVTYADGITADDVPQSFTDRLAQRLKGLGVAADNWEDTGWEGGPSAPMQETSRLEPLLAPTE
ncbi:hypothetical protein FJV41_31200 [Myxococcus llanfairpwllgwyngyllgogerychwyrndrobwllllantysiliogogogochensis]|uniref:Uncharacterized protein n=1 Tax=Myxococcus llanfairpwllgwyngyllgogerychwyrndrobwllllantysiliogogogochensis TaxID=2590453 RepID=A0A540WSJ6_9BACT|nr:helix-turn-helix domain-containing protein [Myxococcus llanfairpwllgwyngyllgogerychwyrndrobwllllantysiliogogogochensis]TQF11995.1 hypothetical protein FJV41_31200 [Myxococcus llanfairpwllgwyngyllgogerychwyrndrobwllllantysiliogogogochensis]